MTVWQKALYGAIAKALGIPPDPFPRCPQCGFYRGVQDCPNSFHDSFSWTPEWPRYRAKPHDPDPT